MKGKWYFVILCTDGQAESVVGMYQSRIEAWDDFLKVARKILGNDHEDVWWIRREFINGTLADNLSLTVERDPDSGPLIIQMLSQDMDFPPFGDVE